MGAITFPFNVDDRGRIAFTKDRTRQFVSEIINCVTTSNYERVMRPYYGGGARDFLFMPLSGEELNEVRSQVRKAIEKDVPDVNVEQVNVRVHEKASSRLDIVILFSLKDDLNRTVFRADVTIDGSVTERTS